MPQKPAKPCKYNGCPNLTYVRYCKEHQNYESISRLSANNRGYTSKWQKVRKQFLKTNPLCISCQGQGKLIQATVVDHIKPHRGDDTLFWDEKNWQPLCKRCHDRKTRTMDQNQGYEY